ncbi:hypothetical protein N5K37_29700 [Delftia tsuruhatensis]|uniref:hypothetical protein n=1 Tax=Delftia tsuruhatensis TaxID=180282 RepID=UPI0024496C3A|nr:hypothetical protein [Delftia tsuruhatensis]MDH2234095.1 hypothetical protein [Delftia tsuruhatensis]
MQEKDIELAEKALGTFVDTSINRIPENGQLVHKFSLPESQIKASTDRARLKDDVVDEYVEFFESHNIHAERDQKFGKILVTVDLRTCVLEPKQAAGLSVAMNAYRLENG